MPNNDRFLDLINALSLIIGIQNLQENREQSAQNNIHSENDMQAQYLLTEIAKKFEEQNKTLSEIKNMLQEILKHLKGLNYEQDSVNTAAEE